MFHLFQVIQAKILVTCTQHFMEVSQQVVSCGDEKLLKTVCATFVRKYTHARVGGHIRGKQEKLSEKRGVRSKGGCSLRDKLYNLSGKKEKGAKYTGGTSAARKTQVKKSTTGRKKKP